ncbi:MAG: HupE/UreJ family protein [Chromatiaceae bacterium]|nr:HupE/UreJ family protein [Gammaproteobacteria bacterium]MCP5306433.1 HupE/UreJ family protein [Chromatiaceae bacterium]MCP5311985.1 HupE/UreJ family protein [Chromatiaceae bacterium]
MTHAHALFAERRARLSGGAAVALTLATPLAHAHHAMGGAMPTTFGEGLISGIAHPVIGLDHLAFLVVAALLSATLSGRARYLAPLAFVVATIAGTLYHLGAHELPLAETVIALSALLGGVAVMLRGSLPALMTGVAFAVIGIFHGYAYGESIIGAEQTPLLSYLVGFGLVQYAIIVGGALLSSRITAQSRQWQQRVARFGGGFAAAIGVLFLGLQLA